VRLRRRWEILLKVSIIKQGLRTWNVFVWFREGRMEGGFIENIVMNTGIPQKAVNL
jgi:hypothetical protein